MTMGADDLALTTARVGAARVGATRVGFCPTDLEHETDPAQSGPLYAWRDVEDATTASDWTEVS